MKKKKKKKSREAGGGILRNKGERDGDRQSAGVGAEI